MVNLREKKTGSGGNEKMIEAKNITSITRKLIIPKNNL